MDDRIRKLKEDADRAFSDRKPLDSLWQDIALAFYPEMADFTSPRGLGEECISRPCQGWRGCALPRQRPR